MFSSDAFSRREAITVKQLSKCYSLYNHPKDRLKQFLWPHRWLGIRQYYRELWALRDINLSVHKGEVIGIVGQNGSGKSTLLQLICGTLTPTQGSIFVDGRIAALLELGAGFNPEFTGRENIYMNAAILGLTQTEIGEKIESIIDFSGVRDFIDQPVKTYSSGMYVRLAFSIAISVNPDILVIDEALSVGDGAFARKSFMRIMEMCDAGKTILFCSHSLFQVESLCSRAIWIDKGKIMMDDDSAKVVSTYQTFLDKKASNTEMPVIDTKPPESIVRSPLGSAHLKKVSLQLDPLSTQRGIITHEKSDITLHISFASDPALPCPTVGVTIQTKDGRTITSAATWEDQFTIQRTSTGFAKVSLNLNQLPLLKGEYLINAYLLCERGIHIYDFVEGADILQIDQTGRLQGYFSIPHQWVNNQ
ncbi:lipopolysaccharide transport system ATP-binding protein [Nitrosomonas sp. PY1]|uniref:ABC transporter ATP-binding protein n=1 Tax=Nitrosomonas sp. PY1 TaxID=1803906 RepID=UPI001FC8DF46|nr:ABC transporter ATP-binding protein [Nitrosomonas sp. PY1]GKS68192.1 lipopolysaccharide transport system ATP-binding protein [Nitrosomonas sp. PY1]